MGNPNRSRYFLGFGGTNFKVFSVAFGFKGFRHTNSKGFIGPIGDDLPSLIPIVISLVIFFSIFTLTLTTYNSKNALIRQQIEMTSIARELKGDSLILGVDQFNKRCNDLKLKRYPYSFMVGIYSVETEINGVVDDFSNIGLGNITPNEAKFIKQKSSSGEEEPFFCSYLRVGASEFSANRKQYNVRVYPVAVQYLIEINAVQHHLVVPGIMTIIFWS